MDRAAGLVHPATLLTLAGRSVLAKAARQSGWFKSVTWMEDAAADIVGPHLAQAEQGFQEILGGLFAWIG